MRVKILTALILLSCSLFVNKVMAEDMVITMVADNWCPFNCDPEDSENPGYLVEIAKKVFEPKGYKIVYSIVPWTRAIEETTEGKYDMLIAASPEESPKLIIPEEPAVSCGFDVFVKDDNTTFKWNGVESIRQLRIGGVQNYMYSNDINAYIDANRKASGHRVQIMRGDNALPINIKKLLGGRIDVLFENSAVLNYKFSQMTENLSNLGLAGKPKKVGMADTKPTMCYLGITPAKERSKKLAQILTEGTRQLEANGTLTKLREKYGMESASSGM